MLNSYSGKLTAAVYGLKSCIIPRLWLNICQYPVCFTLPGKHYV